MQNWHKYVISILLGLAVGAGSRFLQPNPTLMVCAQAGVAGVLPALVSLQMTLSK